MWGSIKMIREMGKVFCIGRQEIAIQGKTVTVSLDMCEQAKCSIDGGNKFIVKDGDTITIGNIAYDGDTYNDQKDDIAYRNHYGYAYYRRNITVPSYYKGQRLSLIHIWLAKN